MTLLLCPKTVFLNSNTAARPTSINDANAAFLTANKAFFTAKSKVFAGAFFVTKDFQGFFSFLLDFIGRPDTITCVWRRG